MEIPPMNATLSPRVITLAALAAFTIVACGGGDSPKADAKNGAQTSASSGAAAVPATETSSAHKPYKVKSGIIESTVDIMGPQKQTIYFDDFGARQAIVTEMEIMGTKSQNIVINADGFSTTYDPQKKTGTKVKLPASATSPNGMPSLHDLTDKMKEELKLKELDTRTIVGKESKGYQIEAMGMPMKVWVWEGIPMRSEISMGKAEMVSEVKKIDLDSPVPADRFVVPDGVTITER
jgi:hypothetical protein